MSNREPDIEHAITYGYVTRIGGAFDRLCSALASATPSAIVGAQTRFTEEVEIANRGYAAACAAVLPDPDRASDEEIYAKLPSKEPLPVDQGGVETDEDYRIRIRTAAGTLPLEQWHQIDVATGDALDAIGASYNVQRLGKPVQRTPAGPGDGAQTGAGAGGTEQPAGAADAPAPGAPGGAGASGGNPAPAPDLTKPESTAGQPGAVQSQVGG